jgi:molybdate transport system substrate-binding protein
MGIRMRGCRGALAVAFVAVALVSSGCSGGSGQAGAVSGGTGSAPAVAAGTVMVMAPAPLKGGLDAAKAAFERGHVGMKVLVNYGHVPALLAQISQGVPADVLVAPDEETMKQVQAKGAVGSTTVAVARNRLVLVAPAANPGKVKDVTALGDAALTVVVCASELPCGILASQLAGGAGVTLIADSREPGGSPAVVTKVAAGEADVGVCFATDAKAAAGKVRAIPFSDRAGGSTTVTAAAARSAANAGGAGQFLAFLSSVEGRAAFTGAGFTPL